MWSPLLSIVYHLISRTQSPDSYHISMTCCLMLQYKEIPRMCCLSHGHHIHKSSRLNLMHLRQLRAMLVRLQKHFHTSHSPWTRCFSPYAIYKGLAVSVCSSNTLSEHYQISWTGFLNKQYHMHGTECHYQQYHIFQTGCLTKQNHTSRTVCLNQ